MRASPGPVVFLDKDGTVIEDVPYNVDPRRIRLAPGAREALRLLGEAGATLVIATNQSGVARGYFTEDDLHAVGRHLADVFADLGVRLEGFYFCPHAEPGDGVNAMPGSATAGSPSPGLWPRRPRARRVARAAPGSSVTSSTTSRRAVAPAAGRSWSIARRGPRMGWNRSAAPTSRSTTCSWRRRSSSPIDAGSGDLDDPPDCRYLREPVEAAR